MFYRPKTFLFLLDKEPGWRHDLKFKLWKTKKICFVIDNWIEDDITEIHNQRISVGSFYFIYIYTLWSYQLLQKGRRFSAAKMHYIDFNWPLMPLSCIDIRYWMSYNPEICQNRWKMTSRKKIRSLGLAQIYIFSDA